MTGRDFFVNFKHHLEAKLPLVETYSMKTGNILVECQSNSSLPQLITQDSSLQTSEPRFYKCRLRFIVAQTLQNGVLQKWNKTIHTGSYNQQMFENGALNGSSEFVLSAWITWLISQKYHKAKGTVPTCLWESNLPVSHVEEGTSNFLEIPGDLLYHKLVLWRSMRSG